MAHHLTLVSLNDLKFGSLKYIFHMAGTPVKIVAPYFSVLDSTDCYSEKVKERMVYYVGNAVFACKRIDQ